MTSTDLRDTLSKLCIEFRDEARFNCNKEWEIKSIVGFCHDSGEQKYKIAWQDSVLSKTDLMCRLVNNKWPLYRFARQITPEGSGSQLRVAWEETWEPANAIFAAAELIHGYWLGVYQSPKYPWYVEEHHTKHIRRKITVDEASKASAM
ncbi:hypothetical protein LTR94_023175, partial [Friedmanniomyces endolithicus]